MDQQTHPPADDSTGPESLYIVTPILVVGIFFYLVRIYTRVVPTYKLNASDYTNTVAVLAGTITYVLFATAVANGFGRHSYYISPESGVTILKCLYAVTLVGLWASVFARISVACLLFQFATLTSWKVILWVAIGFQLASLAATEILELVQCRPIRAFWEVVPGGKCLSPSAMWTVGYVFIGIGMAGDLVFTILPMFLIWRLSRSVVERCLISFLMAMCLFATGAGIPKIIYSQRFDRTSPDVFREMMPVFLWCRMEEVLLILASSAPFLKSPIENILHRMGLPLFQYKPRELNSFHSSRRFAPRHWYTLQRRQRVERTQKQSDIEIAAGQQATSDHSSSLGGSSTCNNPTENMSTSDLVEQKQY